VTKKKQKDHPKEKEGDAKRITHITHWRAGMAAAKPNRKKTREKIITCQVKM